MENCVKTQEDNCVRNKVPLRVLIVIQKSE